MKLFLDLELTLIDTWDECNVINRNVALIRDWIDENEPDEIGVFSFAVWDLHDKEDTREKLRWLWDMLDVNISRVPSVADLIELLKKTLNINVMSSQDFFDFFGRKNVAFEHFILAVFKDGGDFVLFDDCVETHTKTITINDITWNLSFIDVWEGCADHNE
jgi:hypothetical protein